MKIITVNPELMRASVKKTLPAKRRGTRGKRLRRKNGDTVRSPFYCR